MGAQGTVQPTQETCISCTGRRQALLTWPQAKVGGALDEVMVAVDGASCDAHGNTSVGRVPACMSGRDGRRRVTVHWCLPRYPASR